MVELKNPIELETLIKSTKKTISLFIEVTNTKLLTKTIFNKKT